MSSLNMFCMSATTFSKTGKIDEKAFREHLSRFIDAKLGVYLGSGGNGEGHALELGELRRIYEIGVEECAGKVPIHANLPEEMTARATLEYALAAIDAGIEVLHIYTLEGRHGMRPTHAELAGYFEDVLSVVKHPVALAVNPSMGYVPEPKIVADICNSHPQIIEVRLSRVPDTYFINLKAMVDRSMSFCYQFSSGPFNPLALGVNGLFAPEANIIPNTFRRFIALYERRNLDEMGLVYADISRFAYYVATWGRNSARWIKMCMKVLKLPGGEGGLRRPYLMPSDEELQKFTDGLLRLHVPEIDELARNAGLHLPV